MNVPVVGHEMTTVERRKKDEMLSAAAPVEDIWDALKTRK
jgi:hypothetical protein